MSFTRALSVGLAGAAVAVAALAVGQYGAASKQDDKKEFSVHGYYAEACSCMPPCACELSGVEKGCQGVGAFVFTSGKFGSMDFSGTKMAYAVAPGDWVRVYIDAPSKEKRDAAEAFSRAALAGFGKIEEVKDGKIELTGGDGKYTGTVDGGSVMKFETEPITGGDGKTAIAINNINDPVHPNIMMGKTISCTYKDGEHEFTLDKGTNAYFYAHIMGKGKL